MDFAVLPPEVNSGRMYAGAGAGPLVAAASAWDRLSAELNSAAGSYRSVVSELTDGSWRGPASASMTAAAEPYLAWMTGTAAQAAQTASQARAAATAYEQAFAATVPPSAIAANRASLNSLVARNIFGQNSAAIAANQTQYAEMWAQDATAMHSYAASSAAAATLPSFSEPPQTTNPTGTSAELSGMLQKLGNPFEPLLNSPLLNNPILTHITKLFGQVFPMLSDTIEPLIPDEGIQIFFLYLMLNAGRFALMTPRAALSVPLGAAGLEAVGAGLTSSTSEGAAGLTLAGSYGSGLGATSLGGVGASAALGKAAPIGGLSVPPAWDTTTSGVRLASVTVPTAEATGLASAGMVPPGGMFGGPVGSVVNAPRNTDPRVRPGSSFNAVPQIERGAGTDEETPADSALVEPEDRELVQLGDRMEEIAMEFDAISTLMKEAMR